MADQLTITDSQPLPAASDSLKIVDSQPLSNSSVAGDVASGMWSKMNPANMLRGAADTLEHPLDTAVRVLAHPYMALGRAKEALQAGKPQEALVHLSSALDPAGFTTEESAVKANIPGHRAEGVGELLGTGLDAYAGAKAPEAIGAAGDTAKSASSFVSDILSHPKVVKAMKDAAMEWMKEVPGVKPLIKTGKAVGTARDVISDVRQARTAAAPAPPPIPAQSATPAAAPAAEPEPAITPEDQEAVHGGVENTPRPVDDLLGELRSAIEEHLGHKISSSNIPANQDRWDVGSRAPTIRSTTQAPKAQPKPTTMVPKDSPLANNPEALSLAERLRDLMEGDMVELKNGKQVTVKKLNGNGTFEHD